MKILFLIVFVDLIGFGIVIPLLPFYGEHFAASPAEVGMLMAVYSFTQFLAAPLWGRLSDRVGRRPVLIVSLAGIAAAYVWLGFATSLWALFAARAAAGFMAGNISVAFAYVADVTTAETRARGMGLIGAAFGLGFIFGPAIGGVLAGDDPANADFLTPALVAAAASIVALVLTVLRLPESLDAGVRSRLAAMPRADRWRQFRQATVRSDVGLMLAMGFLAGLVFAGLETTFAMWSRRQLGWGPEQNGWLFAYIGLITAAVQGGLIGRLAPRVGETRLLIAGSALLAIGIATIPFATGLAVLLPAMAVVAVGYGISQPALNTLISLQLGADAQGGGMGLARSATTLARIVGPLIAGSLFFWLGKDSPYVFGAIVMAGVVLLALRLRAEVAGPGRAADPAKD